MQCLPADLAAVTVATAASETTTHPLSSINGNVPATAVTTAADVADDAHCDPDANVNGGHSTAVLGNDADDGGAGNTLVRAAVVSVISNAAKSALCAYFKGVNWLLNKALPKGAEFLNGLLGDIMRQCRLVKTQVAHQLLNYKKEKFMNTQVSILFNPSDLDERIREGMAMSPAKCVLSTLTRICDFDPSSHGLDFSNLCVMMKSLPSTACTYVRLIVDSPDDACFYLLVSVVENWIRDMAKRSDFMKEYDSTGLPSAGVSSITFGQLGVFFHLALFMAWSDVICNNEKPPIYFPVDCLV